MTIELNLEKIPKEITGLTMLRAMVAMHEASARGRRLLTLSELAHACAVSTAAITGLVDRGESLGLFARENTKADRRKVSVRLTAIGKITADEMLGGEPPAAAA